MTTAEFIGSLRWDNPSDARYENGKLLLSALPETDYFVNPADGEAVVNAPYYNAPVTGDFTLRAKASRRFDSTFDACALLMLQDDVHWGKLCFESTDFGTRAVVTVVTNGRSDDANGVNIEGDTLWLQAARKGDLFALHYSLDGKKYIMARIFTAPLNKTIKLGFVAQSPTGNGGDCLYEEIVFEGKAPQDMRAGG